MNLDIDELLNEGYFSCLDSDTVNVIIDEIRSDLEKTLRSSKKAIYVNNDTITIKGTTLLNKCSSVKLSDSVEGMILRRYYDISPNVDISVSYFKVGTKLYKNFYNKDKKSKEIKGVNYSIESGMAMTTSIKIKVVPAKKFKVSRIIKFMNNKDTSIQYEKLSEEVVYK